VPEVSTAARWGKTGAPADEGGALDALNGQFHLLWRRLRHQHRSYESERQVQ